MSKINISEARKMLNLEQVQELRDWGEVVTDSGYIDSLFIECDRYEWTEVVTYSTVEGFGLVYRAEELGMEADTLNELEDEVADYENTSMVMSAEQEHMCYW